jgi:hypothetical protein
MEIVAKFRAEAAAMGEKLTRTKSAWKDYLAGIAHEIDTVQEKNPDPINRVTWPTQQNVSQALHRLAAIDNILIIRKAELMVRGESWGHTLLQQRLIDTMRLPPMGSESVTWQLISAAADAEDEITAEHFHLAEHERSMAELGFVTEQAE